MNFTGFSDYVQRELLKPSYVRIEKVYEFLWVLDYASSYSFSTVPITMHKIPEITIE